MGFLLLLGNIHDSTVTDEAIQAHYSHRNVMATVVKGGEQKEYKLKDLAPPEKLEKFVEDVRYLNQILPHWKLP